MDEEWRESRGVSASQLEREGHVTTPLTLVSEWLLR
jgi:hypothetical protein